MKNIFVLLFIGALFTHSAYTMNNKNEQNDTNEVWEARLNRRRFQCITGGMAAIGWVGFASSYMARPRFAALSGATLAAASMLALLDKNDMRKITRVSNGKDHPAIVLTGDSDEIDEIIKDLREMAKRKEQSKKASAEKTVETSEDSSL